jgi:hypothetical protein
VAKFTTESARIAGMKSSRAGKPDKVSQTVKQVIFDIVNNELARLDEALADLRETDPKAYVDAVIKLLPYVISKAPEQQERNDVTWPTSFTFNVLGTDDESCRN